MNIFASLDDKSRTFWLIVGVIGVIIVGIADYVTGREVAFSLVYSLPVIPYWNAAVRLSFFVIVTFLLSAFTGLEHEREAARLDDLTGASNRRHFFEVAQVELDRSLRYRRPFTVLYFDIDDFKTINDR